MSTIAITKSARRARDARREPPAAGPDAAPRFLLYSHDALGLGHVRRNLVIAAALVERDPRASVILATSAEHADSLGVPEGVDLMRLPALRKVGNGHYTPRRLAISAPDLTELRSSLLLAAVETYRPSVMLVDKHPLGVGGELRPALTRLRELGGRAVLGLRDVLDDPATVRAEWTRKRTGLVLEHYAQVLVYGNRAVFDTLRRSGLPSELIARADYCGYVTRPVSGDPEPRGLPALGDRSRPFVLATTGGGEDGRRVLEAFVDAAAGCDWEAVAVTGPQLSAAETDELRERADEAGVALCTFVPKLAAWFGSVDALVCMGGYNTLAEALVRGAPTVCVPRTVPRTEQLIRARALEALGLLQVVEPESLTPDVLRGRVEVALTRSRGAIARAARRTLVFDGASTAAGRLLAEAALSRVGRAA